MDQVCSGYWSLHGEESCEGKLSVTVSLQMPGLISIALSPRGKIGSPIVSSFWMHSCRVAEEHVRDSCVEGLGMKVTKVRRLRNRTSLQPWAKGAVEIVWRVLGKGTSCVECILLRSCSKLDAELLMISLRAFRKE